MNRFKPELETLDIRANPGGRGGIGGELFTGSTIIVGEVQTAEPTPVGGIWVGGEVNGGRGGLSGEF